MMHFVELEGMLINLDNVVQVEPYEELDGNTYGVIVNLLDGSRFHLEHTSYREMAQRILDWQRREAR